MKIVTAYTLHGRGDVLFTDEPYSKKSSRKSGPKKLRLRNADAVFEMPVLAAEPAPKESGTVLSFVVPEIAETVRALIIGAECELVN